MKNKQIVVTGDIALDNNIYKGQRKSPEDTDYGSLIKESKGGSKLLFDLIDWLNKKYDKYAVGINDKITSEISSLKENKTKEYTKEELEKKISKKEKEYWDNYEVTYGLEKKIFRLKSFPSSLITFGTWGRLKNEIPKEFQKSIQTEYPDSSGTELDAWKVFEPLGFGAPIAKLNELEEFYSGIKNGAAKDYDASILVFDDGGNNFRNDMKAWEDLLYENPGNKVKNKKQTIELIILKTASPLGRGKLFQVLTSEFKEKLTIITSVDEIRKEPVLVSKGVSWEQTALDLVYELKFNTSISNLLNCKHLIVNFQSEGVLYLEIKNKDIWKCRLIFDPEFLEGEWVNANKIQGDVIGSMTCFTAAIIYGFMLKEFNNEAMISTALSVTRKYKIIGHGYYVNNPVFPFSGICAEIIEPSSVFASVFVPIPNKVNCTEEIPDDRIPANLDGCGKKKKVNNFQNQNWTILEGNYKPDPQKNLEPLFDTAFRFALFGRKELANTPFLKFEKYLTYDRREIEALRNIKNLIDDYIEDKDAEKPLSIAVFGAPGSGKSFAVKQLAKHLKLPFLEFNLSQFADIHELDGAFHQVRDKVLENKVPIIFWDEFDSQSYRWLQYLLAPMQDGKFQEGQITHPIGRCIFIFAGGTSYTFDTFGVEDPEYPNPADSEFTRKKEKFDINLQRRKGFVLKKGPDFKSRLCGYLNVQGPNQLECLDENGKVRKENGNTVYNEDDIFYPIRRALFLRGLSGKKDDETLDVDYGLLNALIKTTKYTHGSRSLEKILLYLRSKNENKLQRSNLPSFSVLSMLVNYQEFICMLTKNKKYDFQAYKIAPQIHQNWMNIGDSQGWKLEYHKDYNYLPAHLKEENIAAARRIPAIIDSEKLHIVSVKDKDFYVKIDFQDLISDNTMLNKLAVKEHEGWVKTKVESGWQFNEIRNDDRKLHDCIIGWNETKIKNNGDKIILSDKDKDKDKDAIRNYPEVLKAAGFVIVKKKQK
ncbi:MAG: AAA family ATPase [Bacteroidales bacterium]|nr:AAA family ATPase [Bacteroidales bacterium]